MSEQTLKADDVRTAARIVRWILETAEEQTKAMPWWKRVWVSYPDSYLRLMVCNLEAIADKLEADAGEGEVEK